MKSILIPVTAAALLAVGSSAPAQLYTFGFAADEEGWFSSPFGGATNSIAFNSANDNTGDSGGSLEVTVPTASDDNSAVSSDINGAGRFLFITDATAAQLDISAYVFVDTPLTEAASISGGQGGAAVALVDGAVDFSGTITPDADRVLDNAAFEQITAPTLTLVSGNSYNAYLFTRNCSGVAYFDDVVIEDPTASIAEWDVYSAE